jgi:hypothetical protein
LCSKIAEFIIDGLINYREITQIPQTVSTL